MPTLQGISNLMRTGESCATQNQYAQGFVGLRYGSTITRQQRGGGRSQSQLEQFATGEFEHGEIS